MKLCIQKQPSKTSCGPTVVAMIAGTDAEAILSTLPTVRTGKRVKKRTHGTNLGELTKLLKPYGYRLGRRLRDALPRTGTVLLRVTRERSTNWHWMLLRDGLVYDSADATVVSLEDFQRSIAEKRVSFYEVDAVTT